MQQRLYNQDRKCDAAVIQTVASGLRESEIETFVSVMSEFDSSRVIAVSGPEVLKAQVPVGRIDLVLLGADSPEELSQTLRWAKRRWAKALLVVLSERAGGMTERKARQGGALFFQRPVGRSDFQAVVEGMMRCRAARVTSA